MTATCAANPASGQLLGYARVFTGHSELGWFPADLDAECVAGHRPDAARGFDAGKKTNGRKRHIAVDSNGLVLAIVVTVAAIQDRDAAIRLFAALRAAFSTITLVWADRGCAGRVVRWAESVLALTVQIVKRNDDTSGFTVLPRRWVVERTFAWICTHRPCVRDYETRPEHHEAMVYIALIATMSRPKTQCCSDSGRAGSDKHHRKLGHNRAVLPHDS